MFFCWDVVFIFFWIEGYIFFEKVWYEDVNEKDVGGGRRKGKRKDRYIKEMCVYCKFLNFFYKKEELFKFNEEKEDGEKGKRCNKWEEGKM